MNFKVNYKALDKMQRADLFDVAFDGEVGRRLDRFTEERVAGRFAIEEILREAEDFFYDQHDDEFNHGMWRGEFWGKLMLSAVRICKMKGDGALGEALRYSAYTMLSYQRSDGYLSTYRDNMDLLPANVEISMRDVGWECNYNWNLWGQKYTLWALIECALLLDDKKILGGAIKMADNILSTIEKLGVRVKDTGVMHGLASSSIMKPMLLLYRITADQRYLKFAEGIAAELDREDGECPNIIRNALTKKPVAEWYNVEEGWYAKAYEMMSCFDGIIELYRITGNKRYFDAVSSFWDMVSETEVNILGSAGYCERFAFAKRYPDSATEICDAIHWMRLSHELFVITGEKKYVDAFENTFLNAFLAGVYDEGRDGAFFVRSAGRHWIAEPQAASKYQNCCLNNVGRGFANAAETAITKGADGYYINLYTASRVAFDDVSIRVSDGYTTSGRITVTVRGTKKGEVVYLRCPEWCRGAAVMIDGEKTELTIGAYTPITVNGKETLMYLTFDLTPELISFGGEYTELPDDDYHRRRWTDNLNGPCNRGAMVYKPMCHVRRGAVLLARSKRLGEREEDMFSGETVFGKNATVSATPTRSDKLLVGCYVTVKTDDGEKTYRMCDFASAVEKYTEDARYFTIFI